MKRPVDVTRSERAERRKRILQRVCVASAAFAFSACSTVSDPDKAELRNIKPSNADPKSSPTQLVKTFDKFCVEGPRSRSRMEASLRNASFVPTTGYRKGRPQVFLVDDKRPAMVISDTMCIARALSRTGQTERFNDFVNGAFPSAQPVRTDEIGTDIEQAWKVSLPDDAMLATQRTTAIDGFTNYALILFRPNRPMTN